ncbi:MAG: aspartate aminotransferase family protein [Pseudomonadota bacterium]
MPTYARTPLSFVRGEGSWLIDAEGARYLDFGSGIAVNTLGHAHPRLREALAAQAEKLWHLSNLYTIPEQEALAARLVDATFADTVFFTNSGAEAMECAIKTARKFQNHAGQPERWRILTFEGAFHGRTLATIAAAGQPKLVEGFGPMPGGFDQVPHGDLDAVEGAIGPETAAILIEPVQGEGGIRPAPAGFLQGLREICAREGLLLILDEIQCGVGRTGQLFAHEWAGIEPDIMAVAKGIGGGFPVGACLATARAASGMTAGSHGSTYGGNPLAMAVALATLETVLEPGFLDRVSQAAGRLRQQMDGVVAAHPGVFAETRGEGLMLGLRCVADTPCGDVVAACRDAALLTVPAGDNVVRLLPPLNVTDDEIDDAASRIDRAAASVSRNRAA